MLQLHIGQPHEQIPAMTQLPAGTAGILSAQTLTTCTPTSRTFFLQPSFAKSCWVRHSAAVALVSEHTHTPRAVSDTVGAYTEMLEVVQPEACLEAEERAAAAKVLSIIAHVFQSMKSCGIRL